MSRRWRYNALDPGHLDISFELGRPFEIDLEPGQEFDVPDDDWLPEPNPHPVFQPVTGKSPSPIPQRTETPLVEE